jgi:hypothetical protein
MGDGMSQQERRVEVQEQTKNLQEGPLKHIRAAALAAVLVPLASFAATPALAQTGTCSGPVISGFVWFDANNNGIQDVSETGIAGVVVSASAGEGSVVTETDATGHYQLCLAFPAYYTVSAVVPAGYQPSPADSALTDDAHDSDGICCVQNPGQPDIVQTDLIPADGVNTTTDFGFWHAVTVVQPGTGTPGYWKTHASAWPVNSIVVGGVTYTRDQAIALLADVGSDKSLTMFSSLVPAMLNVMIGNNSSCVASTITAADSWMAKYGPAGSKVKASGVAWKLGEPLHQLMDNYNNGVLCAPHRD